jgi:hypothetical protein
LLKADWALALTVASYRRLRSFGSSPKAIHTIIPVWVAITREVAIFLEHAYWQSRLRMAFIYPKRSCMPKLAKYCRTLLESISADVVPMPSHYNIPSSTDNLLDTFLQTTATKHSRRTTVDLAHAKISQSGVKTTGASTQTLEV